MTQLVRVVLPDLPATRNERGQYTSAQADQYNRNKLFSEYLRSQAALRVVNHVRFGKRAGASTGRLLRATADARNAVVTKEFVGVGRPDWLDRSQARYWRTFEEGSAAVWRRPFIGTQLMPKGNPRGFNAHGEVPGIRTAKNPEEASARLRGRFVVSQEIAPANIYGQMRTLEYSKMEAFAVQSARRYLERIFSEENLLIRGKG